MEPEYAADLQSAGEFVLLGRVAEPAARRRMAGRTTSDQRLAGVRREQSGEESQRRRLAGTVFPYERHDFGGSNHEIQLPDRDAAADGAGAPAADRKRAGQASGENSGSGAPTRRHSRNAVPPGTGHAMAAPEGSL